MVTHLIWLVRIIGKEWMLSEPKKSILWKTREFLIAAMAAASPPFETRKQMTKSSSDCGIKLI
jgi:hypothetical protein